MIDELTFEQRKAQRRKRDAVWDRLRRFIADVLPRFRAAPEELVQRAEAKARQAKEDATGAPQSTPPNR